MKYIPHESMGENVIKEIIKQFLTVTKRTDKHILFNVICEYINSLGATQYGVCSQKFMQDIIVLLNLEEVENNVCNYVTAFKDE